MPSFLVRVECCFTFSDFKTFDSWRSRHTHEIRRFSLRLEDTNNVSSNTLYEQLLQNIHTIFGKFSSGLVSNGQPFRLYWKCLFSSGFIAFDTKNEMLEAIYAMLKCGTMAEVPKTNKTPDISYDVLKICVCIRDKVPAEITRPGALFVNFPSTPSSAAATAASATQTSTETSTAPPPETSTSQGKIAALQSKPAASAVTASSSSDDSSDWYDLINLDKIFADCL